jgi:hypothetical protein
MIAAAILLFKHKHRKPEHSAPFLAFWGSCGINVKEAQQPQRATMETLNIFSFQKYCTF